VRALVIIPTYNERDNIREVIEKTLEVDSRLDILVVDDNSSDGTGEIVEKIMESEERVKLMKRPAKLGLGTAYADGFKYALEKGYDCVVEMDADLSHPPEKIKEFLDIIGGGQADVVVGSRYTNGVSVVNWPITRLLLSFYANKYAKFVTGVPVNDMTAGFVCYKKEVIDKILSTYRGRFPNGYSFQIVMKFYAHYHGFRIREIPIIFYERRSGKSKMSKKIVREAMIRVLKLGLQRLKWKLNGGPR